MKSLPFRLITSVLISLAASLPIAASPVVIFQDDFTGWGTGTNGWQINANANHVIQIADTALYPWYNPTTVNGTALAVHRVPNSGTAEVLSNIVMVIDTRGFQDIKLNLSALQGIGSTWEGQEFLKIEYSVGAAFNYQDLFRERGVFSTPTLTDENAITSNLTQFAGIGTGILGSTGDLTLAGADDTEIVRIRIFFNSGAVDGQAGSEVYFLDNIVVTGTVIPEPGVFAALAGLLALGGVIVIKRRRKA
jgi:hypothetical protein